MTLITYTSCRDQHVIEGAQLMRALVTGASGFVGAHLAEHLVAAGDVVVGISASGRWPDEISHLGKLVRLEQFDLVQEDESKLVELLRRKQPEVIYHLAAQSNPQDSLANPRKTWALNVGGTLNLLEAVHSSSQDMRIVVVSSGVCYGNPSPEFIPVHEDCPLRPNNPYAASKAAADLLCIQHYLTHGTKVIIVRPFNHAGPRQSSQYVLAGLALQIAEIEQGLRSTLAIGNLNVVRDFLDVRDVVSAYRCLALQGLSGEIYNLGRGEGTRIGEALDYLRSQARTPIPIEVDQDRLRPVDQPLLVADNSKLRRVLSWEPRYSIEHTLMDMLNYSRQVVSMRSVS
jgi:GDP-4-dehydro-6-deoxy-D-mannose reductase